MILDNLKKANIEALKNKDFLSRGIFSVVLNKIKLEEIRKREKGALVDDIDVSNILQKSLKELADEKSNYEKANNQPMVNQISMQAEILAKFLPQMMSGEEIRLIILGLEEKTLPFVMKHFKANYNGKCDMRLVQETLKEVQWKFMR